MQQGPVPTQLCCGTSKLGGARLTRMKESHEVHEIRQGPSDERPLCWRYSRRYVLHSELFGRLFVCDGDGDGPVLRQRHHQRLQDRSQHGQADRHQRSAHLLRRSQPGSRRADSPAAASSMFSTAAPTPRAARYAPRRTPARTPISPSSRLAATAFSHPRRPFTPKASILSG